MKIEKMVEMFQCPGCVAGCNTRCGVYTYDPKQFRCVSHILGTHLGLGNLVALGLPTGFNKPGYNKEGLAISQMNIRLFPKGQVFQWDRLNIPVWAMVKNGFLFVRTYAPRINTTWVDVFEGGSLSMVPNAVNVGEFINEID